MFFIKLVLILPAPVSAPVKYISPNDLFIDSSYNSQLSQTLEALIQCESGWEHDRYGDTGRAYGLLQFWKGTFNQYCEGDYYSAQDQLICGEEMLEAGLGFHWSCYNKLYAS